MFNCPAASLGSWATPSAKCGRAFFLGVAMSEEELNREIEQCIKDRLESIWPAECRKHHVAPMICLGWHGQESEAGGRPVILSPASLSPADVRAFLLKIASVLAEDDGR